MPARVTLHETHVLESHFVCLEVEALPAGCQAARSASFSQGNLTRRLFRALKENTQKVWNMGLQSSTMG